LWKTFHTKLFLPQQKKKIKQDAIPTLFLNGNGPSNKFRVKILSHHKKTPPQTSDNRASSSPFDLLTKHEPCEAPKVVPILEFSSPWRFTAFPPENSNNVWIPNMHASLPNVSDDLCNYKVLLLDELVNLRIQLKQPNEKYLRLHDIYESTLKEKQRLQTDVENQTKAQSCQIGS
jgi:hypothetical protein